MGNQSYTYLHFEVFSRYFFTLDTRATLFGLHNFRVRFELKLHSLDLDTWVIVKVAIGLLCHDHEGNLGGLPSPYKTKVCRGVSQTYCILLDIF